MLDTSTPASRAAAMAAQTGGPAAAVLNLTEGSRQGSQGVIDLARSVRPVAEVTVDELIVSGATEAEIAEHLAAKRREADAAATVQAEQATNDRARQAIVDRREAERVREGVIQHFRQEIASTRTVRSLPPLPAAEERAAAIRLMDYRALPPADRERGMAERYAPQASTEAAPQPAGFRWNREGTELVPFYGSTDETKRARAMGLPG